MTAASPAAVQLQKAFEQCRDMDGPIGARLARYAEALMAVNPVFAQAVERLIARLAANDCGATAPGLGDEMPDFALPDEQGRIVRLDDCLSKGPTAIMFHRGHWCPYCRINLAAVARHGGEIAAVGGNLIAITPEKQEYAASFKSEAGAAFPVLSDLDHGYALSLNLVIWIGQELKNAMLAAGRSLADYQGNESWMLPIPAAFVVGRDRRIKARFVDPDFRRRMDLDQLMDAIRRG